MQYTAIWIAALAAVATALPQPDGSDVNASPVQFNELTVAPKPVGAEATAAPDLSVPQKCISISSTNENWYYRLQPPWGTRSGQLKGLNGKLCVPTNNVKGGAMFIGPKPNPGDDSTKIECKFQTHDMSNCDISLVQGYSLSATCKAGGQTVGGPVDLWKTGVACPDKSEKGAGICKNDKGPSATAQSQIPAFFQKGVQNGNRYCIFQACTQYTFFPHTDPVSCHISGSNGS